MMARANPQRTCATVDKFNPHGLHANSAFSHVAILDTCRTVLIGGQNAVDAEGRLVGVADLALQTRQALANLAIALDVAGACKEDLVSVSVYLVHDEDIRVAFDEWQRFWENRRKPPIVKVLRIKGLANPAFMIEIEAIAAL